MPRQSKSPYATALAEAGKRLVQAHKERVKCQKELGALDAEIPALERTIAALRLQLSPDVVAPPIPQVKPIPFVHSNTQPEIKVPEGMPPELAKWVLPTDLTGMGSIPAAAEEIKETDSGRENPSA